VGELSRELIARNHIEIGRADGKAAVLLATGGSLLVTPHDPRPAKALRADPVSMNDPDRRHRLRGRLTTASLGGTQYPQWEYEVTAGGRVRYLLDQPRRTVHLVYAATRHPKDTDS
jgi:hypothetical protein